jgi:hypothetical protein
MTYPWEKPKLDYVTFMNTHLRVSVTINGERKGLFAILDDGSRMDAETVMPDGASLVFRVEGHPRTTDLRMTAAELVNYVLTNYKR